eukprot:scaffold1401_cov330-Pavlova_lutheri.AAC.155
MVEEGGELPHQFDRTIDQHPRAMSCRMYRMQEMHRTTFPGSRALLGPSFGGLPSTACSDGCGSSRGNVAFRMVLLCEERV